MTPILWVCFCLRLSASLLGWYFNSSDNAITARLVSAFTSGALRIARDTVDIEMFNLRAISFMVAGLIITLFECGNVKMVEISNHLCGSVSFIIFEVFHFHIFTFPHLFHVFTFVEIKLG